VESLYANWDSMRASNADRERAADVLKAALAEGRLDDAEHRRRLSAVMEAQTYGQLQRLVADLPSGPTLQPARPLGTYPVPHGGGPLQPVQPPTEGLAIASLVLGALTPFTCGLSSVPAVITGHMALNRIRQTRDRGTGLAVGGLSLGYLGVFGILLMVIGLIAG
jgi:hypothetical protein